MPRARKVEPQWDWPAEYATYRRISRQAVYKAIAEGRIQLVQGKVDRAQADREWAENSAPPGLEAPAGPATPGAGTSYNQARTAWQVFRAQMARLDYEERAGRLVDAQAVRAAAFAEGKRTQDKLMALEARLAPLVAMKTRSECARVIRLELRRLLEELAAPRRRRRREVSLLRAASAGG